MKRAFPKLALLALILSAPTPPFLNAQNMSHEEELVRNAYAKLSFLCSVDQLSHVAVDQLAGKKIDELALNNQTANLLPVFTVSDVQTGLIPSIAHEPWGNFITVAQPADQVLQGALVSFSHADSGNQTEWYGARITWTPSHSHSAESEKQVLDMSVADIIKVASGQWANLPVTYTRYAAFTVNATLQGRTTGPHKAIFFFGSDPRGNEVIAINDMMSGSQALWDSVSKPTYPAGLLSSKLRDTPIVAEWLRRNEMPASSCNPAKHDICCSQGHCGISVVDLNRELSKPLPLPKSAGVGRSNDESARTSHSVSASTVGCSGTYLLNL
jgi:hypothetical protein